jgi:hypothetical protein
MLAGNSMYAHLLRNVVKLKAGEAFVATWQQDFTCAPESFRGVVYQLASAKGRGWKGTSVIIGRYVVYSFYKGTDYMRPNLAAYPIVLKMKGEN